MHNKGKDRNKPSKKKMHLIDELMGSAGQINLDGISEPQGAVKLNNEDEEKDDDEDEITMKKNCDKS